jgi:hypothetical protein
MCGHCLNAGCVHCRDARLENARVRRQRSGLTDAQRIALEIFTRPLFRPFPRTTPVTRKTAPAARRPDVLRNTFVFPAGFTVGQVAVC